MTEDDWEKVRTLRMGAEWDEFLALCKASGTTASAEVRDYVRWAVQWPNAPKRLTRPTPTEAAPE
jgi:hypothetical protein